MYCLNVAASSADEHGKTDMSKEMKSLKGSVVFAFWAAE